MPESHERFRLMADAAPVLVWLSGTDKRCTWFNKSWLDFVGRTMEQELGDGWAENVHPGDLDRCVQTYHAAFDARQAFSMEYRLRRHDGEYRWVLDNGAPRYGESGEFTGYIGSCVDISVQKRAEEELRKNEARKSAMFETALDSIISIDHQGRIVEFNAAAERTFGYRRGDVMGKQLVELLIPHSMRAQHRRGLAHYLATGEGPILDRRLELTALRADGAEFPVELAVTRIPTDDPPTFTAYLRDITERKRAEEALRASETALRQTAETLAAKEAELDLVISHTPLLLTRLSRDLRYVFVNRACAEFVGRPVEEIIGRPIAEIMGEEALATIRPYIDAVLKGQSVEFETEVPYARPGRRFMHVLYTPDRNEQGEVIGWVATISDITARKQTENNLRRAEEAVRERAEELEKLMDVLPVAVWIARDPECRDIVGNRAGHELLRVPVGENLSKSADNGHPPDHFRIVHDGREIPASELPMQYAAAYGVEVRGYEEDIVFSDGSVVRAYGSATPLFDEQGMVRGCIAAFMDVTELKQLEERLRETVAALEATDRRKNEFLATLAHELRNPLAPIRNAVQVLLVKGPADPDLSWCREVIDRQVTHMARLLDDLLDLSRITHNKLELRKERVQLADVVHSAVETSRPHIDNGGQELAITLPDQPVYLDADPIRLAQVLSNLLNNAAKYSERGGRIQLTCQRQGSDIVVSVKDDGIGIAADMLPRLFDMFSQAKRGLERSQGGLGIGLSLVRGLVELHGGSIEAHSDGPGRGSEFIVRLPVVVEQVVRESATASNEGEPGRTKRRLLIVDDLKDSADSLAMLLRTMGHNVQTAYDGEEGVIAAEKFRPEVVLLDIGMPILNGYDACRRIREQPWGKGMFLIALTGWGQEDDRRRTQEAGFDHHLVKPVSPTDLMKLLAEVPAKD